MVPADKVRVREDGCKVRQCGHSQKDRVRKTHAYRVGGRFVPARLAGENAEVVEVEERVPETRTEPVDVEPDEVWVRLGSLHLHLPRQGDGLHSWKRDEDGTVCVYPALPPGAELELVHRPEGAPDPAKAQDDPVPPPPDTLPAPAEPGGRPERGPRHG